MTLYISATTIYIGFTLIRSLDLSSWVFFLVRVYVLVNLLVVCLLLLTACIFEIYFCQPVTLYTDGLRNYSGPGVSNCYISEVHPSKA